MLNSKNDVPIGDKKASELPKTFDEVAQEIAKEKGIVLEDKNAVVEIPLSIIDEDNHKVRTVIKKLEEWRWHPLIQSCVKVYVEASKDKNAAVCDQEADGKKSNHRSTFQFLHYEFNEKLFIYRDAVNTAIRNEDYNFSLRKKIIIFLGCRCLYCGNEDIDYLQLDHKNSQGGKERKRFKKRGLNLMLYYWENLIDAYLKLQVLCFKCHKLKSSFRISQEDINKNEDRN